MDDADKERFYDTEIAPVLLDLARKCEAAGISMVAEVEWVRDQTGSTVIVQAGAGIGMQMVAWAARCKGNADALISVMLKHGKTHGHNSALLHILERV